MTDYPEHKRIDPARIWNAESNRRDIVARVSLVMVSYMRMLIDECERFEFQARALRWMRRAPGQLRAAPPDAFDWSEREKP